MINNIINGIAGVLHRTFGDTHAIYKESVKQGLKEPCFIITTLEPTSENANNGHYLRNYPFNITFIPESDTDAKSEMYRTAESLFLILDYINVLDNLRRGIKMRYEIVDDVLHFFVTYTMYVKEIKNAESTMGTLDYNATLEGQHHGN
jgi:hypothetical protein